MADNDDNLMNQVSEMADRLGLTGRDREEYMIRHARGLGFRVVPNFVRDDDDQDSGGGFFGGSRNRDRDRDRDGNRDRDRGRGNRDRDRDGGWF